MILRVSRNGRVIHRQSISLYSSSFSKPQLGGTFNERVYDWEMFEGFGGCTAGTYAWRLTLIDPYGRAAYSKSRTGRFRCG